MLKISALLAIVVILSGCAGSNTKGNTAGFVLEGHIHYNQTSQNTFEIHMYETKASSLTIYGINTTTPEERVWVANDVMSFEPKFTNENYPICNKKIKVLKEESYQVTGHRKKFLNTRWWKLTVECNDINPLYI